MESNHVIKMGSVPLQSKHIGACAQLAAKLYLTYLCIFASRYCSTIHESPRELKLLRSEWV